MHFDHLNYHLYGDEPPEGAAITCTKSLASHEFCNRLHRAYQLATAGFDAAYPAVVTEHWDKNIVGGRRADIRAMLEARDYKKQLRYALSNPINHNLWYGFDGLARHFAKDVLEVDAYRIHDVLRRFFEAAGARMWQEERGPIPPALENAMVVSGLEEVLGVKLDFPAPYPRMAGIADRRGIIRSRALWGLYLAWRAKQAGAQTVLELGGGLGYAAHYASLFGITDYTIVDIPLTLVASGHFLALTNGEEKVLLYGEQADGRQLFRLLPPQDFPAEKRFDMVVNMDSFPEFGLAIAREYVEKIKKSTKKFLSINHECEKYTVRELFMDDSDLVSYSRHPFWLRKGYVEEFFEFR